MKINYDMGKCNALSRTLFLFITKFGDSRYFNSTKYYKRQDPNYTESIDVAVY